MIPANTRRQFIRSTAFGCLSLLQVSRSLSVAEAVRANISASYLDLVDENDAEPPQDFFLSQPAKYKKWLDTVPRPPVMWERGGESIDFRHLDVTYSRDSFRLTPRDLLSLFEANHFDFTESKEPIILFGLRGCTLAQAPTSDFAADIELKEELPDHQSSHCVLGTLRADGTGIWATSGSTVPDVEHMYQFVHHRRRANLLPTGLHLYEVGRHGSDPAVWQPGALRQLQPVCVFRAEDQLSYRLPNAWDIMFNELVHDNIHAGIRDVCTNPPYFSSAGCQTIPGDYDKQRTVPFGAWAQFRRCAGLAPRPVLVDRFGGTRDDHRKFFYALLTGREARLASIGQVGACRRLRFGSRGPAVGRLREALQASKGDVFDQEIMMRLIKWQKERDAGVADAIVTSAVGQRLGISV